MSILEQIKAVEQQAVQARREAKVAAANIMRETEEQAAREAEAMIAEARQTAKRMVAAAEEEAKIKAKAVIAERNLEDRASALAARGKLPAAVAYVIERVVV
ncbi:MAG: hypothetical protein GX084_00125 [Acholeplasmataceae bacterium]|jgi:V/A-type H+-transporting ATPase subunit G/H|nr:hypothetical protein [Acidaminococcaceae bacterium]NLY83010.1 hypothetical protein [Acholeplasmataceae bacterium]